MSVFVTSKMFGTKPLLYATSQLLWKTCIPLALKMPKLTDVDGRACTELGTGRLPRLSLRCQNWSTSSQAGVFC